jgi:hypothetical protein
MIITKPKQIVWDPLKTNFLLYVIILIILYGSKCLNVVAHVQTKVAINQTFLILDYRTKKNYA